MTQNLFEASLADKYNSELVKLSDFVTEKLVILQNKVDFDSNGNIVLNSKLFEDTIKMILQAANGKFPENKCGCGYTGKEECTYAIRSTLHKESKDVKE